MTETDGQTARFQDASRDHVRTTAHGTRLRHVTRALRDAVADLIAGLQLGAGERVLDFGCADHPYRDLLPGDVEYVGADIPGNPAASATVRGDGTLDVPSASFDAVLSTQVLEHVGDPAVYLAECARVLRPGGRLALTTHGMMVYHPDPDDYWRWTSAGLRRILRDAGFEVLSFRGVVGTAATGVLLVQDALLAKVPRWLRRSFLTATQGLAGFLDRRQSARSKNLDALVFAVLARRLPDPGEVDVS